MSTRAQIEIALFLTLLLITSLILSSIAFSRSFNQTNTESSFTPAQIDGLIKLESNMTINQNDCVAAQCFTDTFVQQIFLEAQAQAQSLSSNQSNEFHVVIVSDSLTSPNLVNDAQLLIQAPNISLEGTITCNQNAFVLGNVSSDERLALTATDGTIVYDTTLNEMFILQDNVWTSLSQQGFVLNVFGTPGNIVIGGTATNPIVNLSTTSVVAGNYTWINAQVDSFGRLQSISSNPNPVLSVSGTSNQIVSTGGSNPVISIDPTLFAAIENWLTLNPSGTPLNLQFLMYSTSVNRLVWTNIGSQPFNLSRNIYVDKSGNDTTGNGTNIFPYLTVNKAISVALAGNTSANLQTCILVGAGNYVETNPISITKTGISIFGSTQRGTFFIPLNPSQPFFTLNNMNMMVSQVRFDASSVISTAPCILTTGAMNTLFSDCIFRGFQNCFSASGNGDITSILLVNNCTFVQNGILSNVNGIFFLISNCTITGAATNQLVSSSFNGFLITGPTTNCFISDTFFARCGYCVQGSNDCYVNLSSVHCGNSLTSIVADTQGYITCVGSDFSNMDTGQVACTCSDLGSTIIVTGSNVNGLNTSLVNSGTGFVVKSEGTIHVNSCHINHCVVAALVGLSSDSASTNFIASNTAFHANTTSIHVQGTSTFGGLFLTFDSTSALVFDSTLNVKLALATFDADGKEAWLQIGPVQNTEPIAVIGIATKIIDSPLLQYNPSIYACETLQFLNPDTSVNSAFANVCTLDSQIHCITNSIDHVAQLNLFSDIGNPIGDTTNVRGWSLTKESTTGTLLFNYTNHISGQPDFSSQLICSLNAVEQEFLLTNIKLEWTLESNLYEDSANVLKTDGTIIIGGLTNSDCVVIANGSKQLTASNVSSTELNYLSGVTSNIQTQLNNKLNLSGGNITGGIQSSFLGSNTTPSFGIDSAGIYALSTNHLTFETNNVNRIDIDATGTITLYDFMSAGILHTSSFGILSTSLIVNADITNTTITNAKLATVSSTNNANYIVNRDTSGNFQTNMITILGTVTNNNDVATKQYVDTAVQTGFNVHAPVVVVSVANVALTGLQTIDGILLVNNDRVLLVGQTNPVQNGPWVAHSGAWTRPTDFATGSTTGTDYFSVQQGTIYAGSSFVCTTPGAIVDTDPLTFQEFSQPGNVSGANDGTGQGLVYSTTSGNILHFRSLLAGSNYIQIMDTTNEVQFDINTTSASTPLTIINRDASGDFAAHVITATLIGSASLNLLLTGGILTGNVRVPNGNGTVPSLQIGSSNVGFSQNTGSLQFSTNGVVAMSIDSSSNVTLTSLASVGIVHTNVSGLLTTSLIVNADITPATISNDKLATISEDNLPNYIVVRDALGDFDAHIITSDLVGNVTGTVTGNVIGHASLDLALTGGIMTGATLMPNGTTSTPSLQIGATNIGLSSLGGNLQFSTNGTLALTISSGGTLQVANLSTGLVHSNVSGILTSSLLVDGDITVGTISNNKLNAISSTNVVNNIVVRDGSGGFATSSILLNAGSAASPSLQVGTSAIGLSSLSGALQLSTNSTLALSISSLGVVTISNLSTGLLHADSSGTLTSSLLVDADITVATIANNKLATISSTNLANNIVVRDGSGNFSAGTITATLTGHASGDVALTGAIMTGALQVPVGLATLPSLQVGSTTVGLSNLSGALQLSTNSLLALSISTAGVVRIVNVSTGLLHADSSGNVTSSLLVDADITVGTIANNKLAAISSSNVANDIVVRDASGNFSAGTITASLTGHASGDVALTGSIMTGALQVPVGLATLPSLQVGSTAVGLSNLSGSLQFSTNSTLAMTISSAGLVTMAGALQVPVGLATLPSLQIGSTAVGLSNLSGALQLSTNSLLAMSISTTGVVTVSNLSTGLVHSGAGGALTSSLLVDADIAIATIANNKLAAISSSNVANDIVVRDASGNFDAGTINLTNIDSTATTINIGPTVATSVVLGRSGQTVQSVGTFFTTISKGTFVGSGSVVYTANTAVVNTFSGAVNRTLSNFTQSNGVLTYTGARTRTFFISYNITFTSGANGTNMTWFNSINGSTTIAATQTSIVLQINGNNGREICECFTDEITLSNNQTVQLASICAANATITYQRVCCNIHDLFD
jgi:hypothetical protein